MHPPLTVSLPLEHRPLRVVHDNPRLPELINKDEDVLHYKHSPSTHQLWLQISAVESIYTLALYVKDSYHRT